MSISPRTAAKAAKVGHIGFKFWRRNHIGKKLTRALFPKIMRRVDARRAARGERPADEFAGEFFSPDEERTMLPNGTATKTGAGIAASGPVVGLLVTMFVPPVSNMIVKIGMAPAVCAPEADGCVPASVLAFAIITGLVTSAGSYLAKWGRDRAEKRHAAEVAAAQKVSE